MAGDGFLPTKINSDEGNREGNPRWERNQKMHLMAASMMKRRKLADLTNTKGAARAGVFGAGEDLTGDPRANPKDYIDRLIKVIDERNKTIDLMNIELRNLQLALRDSYQQNRELARANNLFLEQNNSFKEREKVLLHELACNKALLKSMTLELKEKRLNKQIGDKIRVECTEVSEEASHFACDKNASEPNKEHTSRNQSLTSTALSYEVVGREEKADRSRKSSWRIADNLSSEYCDPIENAFSRENADITICSLISEPVHEDGFNQLDCSAPTSSSTSTDQSLGSTALPHEIEGREKAVRKRKSTRRKDAKLSPECCDPVNYLLNGEGANHQVCSLLSDPVPEDDGLDQLDSSALTNSTTSGDQSMGSTVLPHEVERRDKTDRRRKSSRRTALNLTALHDNALCSTALPRQVEEKENVDRRRKSSRRTADNLSSEHCGPTEDLFQKEDAKFPLCSLIGEPEHQGNELDQLDSLACCHSNKNMKHGKDDETRNHSGSLQFDDKESQRPSFGRPTRSAARKVCSYKELPVNIKMRRVEEQSGVFCWTSNADIAK